MTLKFLAEIEESFANELEEQVNEDHTTHWPETEETSYMKKRPSQPTTQPSAKPLARPSTSSPFRFASSSVPDTGKFIMMFGDPGEGKTTLAAEFPEPIFIITHGETGIDSAKNAGVARKDIPVVRLEELYKNDEIPDGVGHPGYTKCIETLWAMSKGGHDRRTAVVDTLSGFEKINEQHCASLEFKGDMKGRQQDEWNAWAAGPRRAETYWNSEFIPACLACIEAGYNVVLLAHCKSATIKNPNGPDYQRYQPDLADRIFNSTAKSLQYLLYLGKQPDFETDKATKKRTVKSNERFIGITNETWYAAKNWDNLQDPIFCGMSSKETYANLTNFIKIK